MWSNIRACVFILATVTVNAQIYTQSVAKSGWFTASCPLAEPKLIYRNGSFEVNETLTYSEDVWIGYFEAKIPFLFIGCTPERNEPITNVTSVGYCHFLCGGGTFGIKKFDESTLACQCDRSSTEISATCIGKTSPICAPGCFELYVGIKVEENTTLDSGDCLGYFYPRFEWRTCTVINYIQTLCSNSSYLDNGSAAHKYDAAGTWAVANQQCLERNMYPAFVQSIKNAGFGQTETQFFWTGIIKSTTVIRKTTPDNISKFNGKRYAYLDFNRHNNNNKIQFQDNGNKKSLCVQASETTQLLDPITLATQTDPIATTFVPITNNGTGQGSLPESTISKIPTTVSMATTMPTSVTGTKMEVTQNNRTEIPATGIGIGVSVGLVFIIGGAVVIFVLARRKVLPCKAITNMNQSNSAGKPESDSNRADDLVETHNYFILDKISNSVEEHAKYFNAADGQNDDCQENDNYNSIDDTDEQYDRVNDAYGDYDYTINVLTVEHKTQKSDNVYNKLKLDRPCEYDHEGKRRNNEENAVNDYHTTSPALSCGTEVDNYNHISQHFNRKCAEGNGTENAAHPDYGVFNDSHNDVGPNDANDYAHVKRKT